MGVCCPWGVQTIRRWGRSGDRVVRRGGGRGLAERGLVGGWAAWSEGSEEAWVVSRGDNDAECWKLGFARQSECISLDCSDPANVPKRVISDLNRRLPSETKTGPSSGFIKSSSTGVPSVQNTGGVGFWLRSERLKEALSGERCVAAHTATDTIAFWTTFRPTPQHRPVSRLDILGLGIVQNAPKQPSRP